MFNDLILKSLEILAENKKPQKKKGLELFETLFGYTITCGLET